MEFVRLSQEPALPEAGLRMSNRDRLRSACGAQHAALDDFVSRLLNAGSPRAYRRYLQATHGLWSRYTQSMSVVARHVGIDCIALELLDCLAEDLSTSLVQCSTLQVHPNRGVDHALGQAYVLEGSSLGAKILHRRLRSRYPDASFRFLAAQTSLSSARWPRFVRSLESPNRDIESMKAGAEEAFDSALSAFRVPKKS